MDSTHEGIYVPCVKAEDCNRCGLCLELCPGANENFQEINEFVFGKVPDDVLLGHFTNCYTGYSTDSEIRHRATSGGLITTLLLSLLREKMIDGAVLTRLKKDEPLKGEPFIARSEEEILSGMGSKYVPVPINTILKTVLEQEGKFAIVALPCHLHGIRRAEMKIRGLQEKLVYHFGLTCSHTMTERGVKFVLNKAGVSAEEIAELKYRGNGWPGGLSISLKNGQREFIQLFKSWWSEIFGGLFFTPGYCEQCCDHFSEFADISFADAWLRDIMRNDKTGTSIVVARNNKAQEILEAATSGHLIHLENLDRFDVVRSQAGPVLFKKRNIRARINVRLAFGVDVPENLRKNKDIFVKPTILDYLVVPMVYWNIFTGCNRVLRALLKCLPFQMVRAYRFLFKQMIVFRREESLGE